MSYGLVRTRYNWNFSKILILSSQTIDFYDLYIAHVLLFTLAVFKLALPLWAWLYILTNTQCVLLWILSFLINHTHFHNEKTMFVSRVTL